MLNLKQISYETNERKIFSNISFSINGGDRIGLVGKNGIGKTTLIKIITGDLIPSSGQIIKDSNYTVGLVPQNMTNWLDYSVYGYFEVATGLKVIKDNFENARNILEQKPTDQKAILNYTESLDQYSSHDISDFDNKIKRSLQLVGLNNISPDTKISNLSGGQKTKISLAAIMLSAYDIVILDEPTNSLDEAGIKILEDIIHNSKSSFLVVSHDRNFLRNIATKIVELIGGDNGIIQYGLGYDDYIKSHKNAAEALKRKNEIFERQKIKLKKSVVEIRQKFVKTGHNKQSKDNDKLLFNSKREQANKTFSKKLKMVESRFNNLETPEEPIEDLLPNYGFKGDNHKQFTTLKVENVIIRYNNNKEFGPFNLQMSNSEKILLRGDNGTGKTSLLNAIADRLTIRSGKIDINSRSKVIYIDQDQSLPIAAANSIDNLIKLSPETKPHDAIIMLLKFGIHKDTIFYVTANNLSGGERIKVLLGAAALNQSNLLILDEPTNNLDIPTMESLEKAINNFGGSIILTSHDIEFVSNLTGFQVIDFK
jgi:ATPase subunit of ABC transporter with duplicated ATPase domains